MSTMGSARERNGATALTRVKGARVDHQGKDHELAVMIGRNERRRRRDVRDGGQLFGSSSREE